MFLRLKHALFLRFAHHLVQTTVVHLVNLRLLSQGFLQLSNPTLDYSLTYLILIQKSYPLRLLPARNPVSSPAPTTVLVIAAVQRMLQCKKLMKPLPQRRPHHQPRQWELRKVLLFKDLLLRRTLVQAPALGDAIHHVLWRAALQRLAFHKETKQN